VGLTGAAVAAETVAYGWIAEGGGDSTTLARLVAWFALGAAATVALLPQRIAEKHPHRTASLAAVPFGATLIVWATASGAPSVGLPHDLTLSPRDVFAQGVVFAIGATAGAIGILVLWSLVASARQARDMGEGLAAIGRHVPWLFGLLLGAKVVWLIAAQSGVAGWEPPGFGGEGPVGWMLAGLLALWWGRWLGRRGAGAPDRESTDEVLRWFGIGFAAVFILAVVFGLVAAALSVLPVTWPVEGLNEWIGWLVGPDPPVVYWGIVATVAVGLAALSALRRRLIRPVWWAAAMAAVWMAPRALELAARIVELDPPLLAPNLATVDTAMTVVVVWLAIGWWTGRQLEPGPGTLMLVLVVSTLVAHPFRILPSAWRTGGLFYLLVLYPVVYGFVFDAATLNESIRRGRPEKAVRETSVAATLLTTTSMLIGMGITGPATESLERLVLGQAGRAYLLVPAAALAVAAFVAGAKAPPRPDSVRERRSTHREAWAALARTLARRRTRSPPATDQAG
jgi:hypothetical protein